MQTMTPVFQHLIIRHAFVCIPGAIWITPLILYDRCLLPLRGCHNDHQVLQPAGSVQSICSNRLGALLC